VFILLEKVLSGLIIFLEKVDFATGLIALAEFLTDGDLMSGKMLPCLCGSNRAPGFFVLIFILTAAALFGVAGEKSLVFLNFINCVELVFSIGIVMPS
jgi:hypothetical protein